MASVTLMSLMKDVAAALEFDNRERAEVLHFSEFVSFCPKVGNYICTIWYVVL